MASTRRPPRGVRAVMRVVVWMRVEDEGVFRAYMKKAGLNGQTLADKVGCSRVMISLLARGKRTCTSALADAIEEALRVNRGVVFVRSVSPISSDLSTSSRKKAA